MPEMKNSFQKGRMNKDLDERMVPSGEYRDALNVEVTTSEGSDVGTLQNIKSNRLISFLDPQGLNNQRCIGSIVDHPNDKIYWMVSGDDKDMIVEYDYVSEDVIPVCVDAFASNGVRALNFDPSWLITGINIIDGILFWTDNNTEPKRINIERGIQGSNGFSTHTNFLVRDVSTNAGPNSWPLSVGDIKEEHLTVIKKGPPTAPVLEMMDTNVIDVDGDGLRGGAELESSAVNSTGTFIDGDGEWLAQVVMTTSNTMDYNSGDYVSVYQSTTPVNSIRGQIFSIVHIGGGSTITLDIVSGIKDIEGADGLFIKLEQKQSLFTFKFPRFAYRYKYEDGEYSQFSPFSQPAFLPGKFNYLPKEGYNLGMVNRVRKLVIKDFVHARSLPDDVISIDILYKESNSPNIYSVKTVKKRDYNPLKWDEWNGTSANTIGDGGFELEGGMAGMTKGYMPITTEMIHAVLPANQLLRPWDNVPRKALAQELVGNRLVYGNYLQNYNLTNLSTNENNIKVDLKVQLRSSPVGNTLPEEVQAGPGKLPRKYGPAKSIKSLRTYQIGITYLDEYGRETPVLSEDKRGEVTGTGTGSTSQASIYVDKESADQRSSIIVEAKNNPPDWATHMKFFVKETSNEYYNLAMDRWYDAEDGNVWLSFPSAERNKVDEETFLILKKQHDTSVFVSDPAKYKIIAIENEAPRFIKLSNISMGGVVDGEINPGVSTTPILGIATAGFPLEGAFFIYVEKGAFEDAGWKESLVNQDISQVFLRVKSAAGISLYYRLKQISFKNSGAGYYKLESAKVFGGDMAHTSPDGTFGNRDPQCEVQLIKRIPEDKAEFEGRFFAKILKDGDLIENLQIQSSTGVDYIATSAMRVQYINPLATQAVGGWDGFGTADGFRISMDRRQNDHFSVPGTSMLPGQGEQFWGEASRIDPVNGGGSNNSSGWFIDAVEAFRPHTGSDGGKNVGVRQNPHDTAWLNLCWAGMGSGGAAVNGHPLDESFDNDGTPNEWAWINAKGLNSYNQHNGYLGTSGNSNMKSPGDKMQVETAAKGGQVAKSNGIDTLTGQIQISYSGININQTTTEKGPSSWASLDTQFVDMVKHVGDVEFITKLTQPGTLWRWKEDPGQVIYKTKATTGLTATSSPYTSSQFQREQSDFDGGKGVFLWNYVVFADYPIEDHHFERKTWNSTCTGQCTAYWVDWISRDVPNSTSCRCSSGCQGGGYIGCSCGHAAGCTLWKAGKSLICSKSHYSGVDAANVWANSGVNHGAHDKFPAGVPDWDMSRNKRRRFVFSAEPLLDPTVPIGGIGPHFYLPTNSPKFDSHFNATAQAIETNPSTLLPFANPAPGIRPDGMYTTFANPQGSYSWDPDGSGAQPYTDIPQYKRWDASGNNVQSAEPGSVTWEIVEQFSGDEDNFSSTNPAIWETEPKEDVGLDIYSEVGQIYPIYLNDNTIEQFVGAVSEDITKNSYIQCWDPAPPTGSGLGTINLSTGTSNDIRVVAVKDDKVMLADTALVYLDGSNATHTPPQQGSYLMFWRADGSVTEAHVGSITNTVTGGTWYQLVGRTGEVGVHNKMVTLPWFNCYSFGNGVESDRIRDDYNQVTIDNGPKASTTIEGTYVEDRKKNGFIWSGIYNSTSGVNNLNQFIQAEAITKDVNPSYGSIQKMFVRDSDLVAYCEDRVLKIYANKDALYNADGNTNVVATNKVLGAVKPFVGDYGISKNPESFASDNYRSYFADTSRGAVLRLSMDGITPISNVGMKDWFSDIMPMYATRTGSSIIGSFDDKKEQYNITFRDNPYDKEGIPRMLPPAIPPVYVPGIGNPPGPPAPTNPNQGSIAPPPSSSAGSYGSQTPLAAAGAGGAAPATFGQLATSQQPIVLTPTIQLRVFDEKSIPQTTVSFNEPSKAWVSFKSWIQEGGVSLNNSYYTFSGGELWRHHDMETRNNFYGTQYESSVRFLFNQGPSIIKSFSTLNYEGTQAKVTQDTINNPDYYDNIGKTGWYVKSMRSNAQEVGELEFWDKEDKWFSQIKGTATKWLNDGTAGNIDPREFSYQGIGNAAGGISCPDCPEQMSWECGATTDAWEHSCCDDRPIINQQFDNGIDPLEYFFDNPMVPIRSIFGMKDTVVTMNVANPVGAYVPATMCSAYEWTIFNPSLLPNNTNNFIGQNPALGLGDGISVKLNSSIYSGYIATNPNQYNGTGRLFVADTLNVNAYIQWWIDNVDNTGIFFLGMNRTEFIDVFSSLAVGSFTTGFMYWGLAANWAALPCGQVVTGGGSSTGCIEVAGASGYSTQQECIDSGCGQAAESWTCGPNGCIDPGDGSGQYATECDCAENCCDSAVIRFFDCQNLSQPNFLIPGCMDDGITQDSWIIANRPTAWVGPASNFNNNANYDDCNCIYSTATSWDCDGMGNCSEAPGDTGTYATLADCNVNCAAPALPTWNCELVYEGDTDIYDCVDPGDGSGMYGSLSSCQANCQPEGWECINGGCVDTGTGQYATYADCNNHCFPVTYNCSYDNQMITCINPGNGTGFYTGPTALYDCQNDPNSTCIPTPPANESWNCSYDYVNHSFSCVDPGDGSGTYATNALCLADQFTECYQQQYFESYNCVNSNCIDPGDGSGQYTSLLSCQNHCAQPQLWECVNGTCVAGTVGVYTSLAACQSNTLDDCHVLQPEGCTDMFADNYTPGSGGMGNCSSNLFCLYSACLDPLALNYCQSCNLNANTLCIYPIAPMAALFAHSGQYQALTTPPTINISGSTVIVTITPSPYMVGIANASSFPNATMFFTQWDDPSLPVLCRSSATNYSLGVPVVDPITKQHVYTFGLPTSQNLGYYQVWSGSTIDIRIATTSHISQQMIGQSDAGVLVFSVNI